MSIKWQRNYSLTAQLNDGTLLTVAYPLTLEFNINRRAWSSTNRCMLRVKNINPAHRSKILRDAMNFSDLRTLQLSAGYGPAPWPVIFNGNILQAYSFKESGSPDFITEWQGWDFGYPISTSFSNVTLSGSQPKQAVINNLVTTMTSSPNSLVANNTTPNGLQVGYISAFPGNYPRGRVLFGSTWNILQQESGNTAFIDNGFINVLQPNDTFGGGTINLDAETGLLSPPRRTESYLEIEILFEPTIRCGQQVNLISQTIPQYNGTYQVFGIDHQGVIAGSVNGKAVTKLLLYYQVQSFNQITAQGLPNAGEGILG